MINFDKEKHSKEFVSNPGSRFKEEFHGVIQEDGSIELVSDGVIDWYKEIQADAVGCSVPEIVARAIQGDPTAFRAGEGFYADITEMPKTFAEVLNAVNDGRTQFEKLPLDVRVKFNNNFEEWFATLGNNEWLNKMGFVQEKKEEEIVDEVKE